MLLQGSVVQMNLYSVHLDPTYWKDPETFDPTRHLDAEGKIIRTDHLIPFGVGNYLSFDLYGSPALWYSNEIQEKFDKVVQLSMLVSSLICFNWTGKRMCPGESLAKNTFYLFLTSLVKTFEFSAVSDQPMPTLNPRNGFTLGYEAFEAVVKPRDLSC